MTQINNIQILLKEEKGVGIIVDLYEIKFSHYSQKDSEDGIIAYAIANSDEEVYEWIKSEPNLEGNWICSCWKDKEDDGGDYDGLSFKDYILSVGGDMYSEYENFDDLYYGKTLYGWEKIKENIQDYQITALMETIGLVDIGGYLK